MFHSKPSQACKDWFVKDFAVPEALIPCRNLRRIQCHRIDFRRRAYRQRRSFYCKAIALQSSVFCRQPPPYKSSLLMHLLGQAVAVDPLTKPSFSALPQDKSYYIKQPLTMERMDGQHLRCSADDPLFLSPNCVHPLQV